MSRPFPDYYMITGKFIDHDDFSNKLEAALKNGNRIVQLRCKTIRDADEYLALANIATALCRQYDALLLLATAAELFDRSEADGLHLSSDVLNQYSSRPVAEGRLLSVSCHAREDMQKAVQLGADILLLSPVKATSSHPDIPGIGWKKFSEMIAGVDQPVYALGGMKAEDLGDAKKAGGQGIAAINALWNQ
ncbi:MAG: thiamine phosphate synthase [gamma proteobacterium endosymbiont of Lamellibrachia anaximandri]|nr:thiamine phosphate synthase [gamma proteobacterium endosymbiont of Lamellibrachia anaximandri]MBL3617675.1 thiamine phosphate synthase [gamma proteobacterium endosymbiont of Lamellibrachia anaximandri]